MANLELHPVGASHGVSVITQEALLTSNQGQLIPVVLHMPPYQEGQSVLAAVAPILVPTRREDHFPLLALPEREERVVRSRLHLFTSAGMRIHALVEGLRVYIAEAPPVAAQLFAEWPTLFADLPHDDRQAYMDALAMLLLGVIRPILLNAEPGSEQQEQALTWDEEIEAIFAQLWPDVNFAAFIQECDSLMREEENTHILCTRLDRTMHVQVAAAQSLLASMRTNMTEGFIQLRQRFIHLQNARQRLRRDHQVDAIVRRTEQVAQHLLNQTRELACLSRAFLEQATRHHHTLKNLQNLLERSI